MEFQSAELPPMHVASKPIPIVFKDDSSLLNTSITRSTFSPGTFQSLVNRIQEDIHRIETASKKDFWCAVVKFKNGLLALVLPIKEDMDVTFTGPSEHILSNMFRSVMDDMCIKTRDHLEGALRRVLKDEPYNKQLLEAYTAVRADRSIRLQKSREDLIQRKESLEESNCNRSTDSARHTSNDSRVEGVKLLISDVDSQLSELSAENKTLLFKLNSV